MKADSITETNKLISVCALVTHEVLGIRHPSANEKIPEPYWKRKIEKSINSLRKNLRQLQRSDQGKPKREGGNEKIRKNI